MLLSVTFILWSVILGPLLYYAYKFAVWFADVKKRGRAVDQFPGEPKHWFWGHLHLFSGAGEDGLIKFWLDSTKNIPRAASVCDGPLRAIVALRHPDTVLHIVRTDGPNEKGLAIWRKYVSIYPRYQGYWRGPFLPVVGLKHPLAKCLLSTTGLDEAGLAFFRETTVKYPRITSIWVGPFHPNVELRHSETVSCLLKTGGHNEAGLAFFRETTVKYPRIASIWLGPFHPNVELRHSETYPGPTEEGLKFQRLQTGLYPYAQQLFLTRLYPFLLLHHPITLAPVVKNLEPKPLGLGVYTFGLPWLGEGLLISGGKKWARNRKLLTPAFHFDILKPYMAVNNHATEIFMEKLAVAAESNESFEVFNHVSLLTLDVILRCAFSYENDCQIRGEEHPYVKAVCELGDLWVERSLKPWLYIDFLYYLTSDGRKFRKYCDYVHAVSEEIIAKRKATLQKEGDAALNMKKGRYLDFLDILLTAKDDEGKGLDDIDIRAEVDTFLFEGHDTTASSIAWMIYSMASHPEFQKKCQAEIDLILEGRDSDEILWEDLPKLKYLTMCLKESMRLHTPVPFIERQLTKDMVIDGKTLPPGSIVAVQIYNLHHNPTVWEDPMEYRPDRFLPENMEKMDNYAFIPFSAGPRNCIGQHFAMHEQKTALARILHRYDFELDAEKPVEKKIGVVMKTKDGMFLHVKRR